MWSDGADKTTQCLALAGRQAMRGRRSCVRGRVLARVCVHARPGNARAWRENWWAGAHERGFWSNAGVALCWRDRTRALRTFFSCGELPSFAFL